VLVAKLERRERHAPPTEPSVATPPPSASAAPATESRPALVATPTAAPAKARARRRGLIIGLTAGAVLVAGGVIAIGIAFGTSTGPVPTIGSGHLQ
jgi:hypothetical protein